MPHWKTTRITYPSASARQALVTDHLPVLAAAADGPWFWVDPLRSTGEATWGVLEVGIATSDGRVPTQWFRDAVARALVERAVPIGRSGVLDPGLFPRRGVPSASAPLLAATSARALDLLRLDGNAAGGGGVGWATVRDELATMYQALLPDASLRRRALLDYVAWLERTTTPPRSGFGPRPPDEGDLEGPSVPRYDELGARLRLEIGDDEELLVVAVARLAHAQVVRLRPDRGDPEHREVRIVQDLSDRTDGRPPAHRVARRAAPTVFDDAARQLELVCEAVDQAGSREGVGLLRAMAGWCGDHEATDPPRWSCLGDDCSPFEVSLATSRSGHQVRFLVEAQADPATPETYWDAGCRLTRWLAGEMGLNLAWFDAIVDLFAPVTSGAYWAMWHAVDLGQVPVVKVYLNPRLGGRPPSAVVHDVMARLGFGAAWPTVLAATAGGAAPSHVSFDLDGTAPRLKVYLRHEHAELSSLTQMTRSASDTAASDFASVCGQVCDDVALLRRRSPFTTLYFVDPDVAVPERVALHLPAQAYVPDDVEAGKHLRSLLASFGLDTSGYDRARARLSAGNGAAQGLHSYVGFQRDESGPRVTTYFGARLYAQRHGWLARAPVATWPSPLSKVQ